MSAIPRTESERNYAAFLSKLPDLLQDHQGKYALIHAQKIEGYYDSAAAAILAGSKSFKLGEYSVQEVTEEVESLGFYSYAGIPLQA